MLVSIVLRVSDLVGCVMLNVFVSVFGMKCGYVMVVSEMNMVFFGKCVLVCVVVLIVMCVLLMLFVLISVMMCVFCRVVSMLVIVCLWLNSVFGVVDGCYIVGCMGVLLLFCLMIN